MSYGNKHMIKDGRMVLYTRDGSAIYHARLSVEGVPGYAVKSTKQRSLDRHARLPKTSLTICDARCATVKRPACKRSEPSRTGG